MSEEDLYDSQELITRIKELYEDPNVPLADISYMLNVEYAAEKGIDLRITRSRVDAHIANLLDTMQMQHRPAAIAPPHVARVKQTVLEYYPDSEFCAMDIFKRIHGGAVFRRSKIPSIRHICNVLEAADWAERTQTSDSRDQVHYRLRRD